jgi:hypothetical protein
MFEPGGDAVVGDGHRAAGPRRLGARGAEQLLPARDFRNLDVPLALEVLARQAEDLARLAREVDLPVLDDHTHGQFRLGRRAQLPRPDRIQVGPQLPRQGGPDDDLAARDREH